MLVLVLIPPPSPRLGSRRCLCSCSYPLYPLFFFSIFFLALVVILSPLVSFVLNVFLIAVRSFLFVLTVVFVVIFSLLSFVLIPIPTILLFLFLSLCPPPQFTFGFSRLPTPAQMRASLADQLGVEDFRRKFRKYAAGRVAPELPDFYKVWRLINNEQVFTLQPRGRRFQYVVGTHLCKPCVILPSRIFTLYGIRIHYSCEIEDFV